MQGSQEKLSLIEFKPHMFDFSRSRRKVSAGSPYAIGDDQGGKDKGVDGLLGGRAGASWVMVRVGG